MCDILIFMATLEMNRKLPLRQLRDDLGSIVNETSYTGKRTVITRNGKDVAAIISIEDLELIEQLEEQEDVAAFDEAIRNDDGQRTLWDEFCAQP